MCKIKNGEIPSYKLYEDDDFIVILDKFPSGLGHTLIITKEHYENIYQLDKDVAKRLFPLIKKFSKILHDSMDIHGINILQNNGQDAGQTINHFHVHLIPRLKDDAIKFEWENLDVTDDEFSKVLKDIKEKISETE